VKNIYSYSSFTLWLDKSKHIGFGTIYSISGKSSFPMFFLSSDIDLPFDPIIPFLISTSSLRFFSFYIDLRLYRSSISAFCSQPINSCFSPYTRYCNSSIFITLSRTYLFVFDISIYFQFIVFFDFSTYQFINPLPLLIMRDARTLF
jgi:hypothetical protein